MAILPQVKGYPRGLWREQPQTEVCYMDMSGILQSIDPHASVAGMDQANMAPSYINDSFRGNQSSILTPSQQFQQMQNTTYGYTTYSNGASTTIVPAYGAQYIQQRPLPQLVDFGGDKYRTEVLSISTGQRAQEDPNLYTSIKPESISAIKSSVPERTGQGLTENSHNSSTSHKPERWGRDPRRDKFAHTSGLPRPSKAIAPINNGTATGGSTEVDALMRAIQARSQESSRSYTDESEGTNMDSEGAHKRYRCNIDGCKQRFPQKTHREIHERSHTGVQPYQCRFTNCGRRFSQPGNLKTHEKRHTGEKPHACEICQKRFTNRGGLAVHANVHSQNRKAYLCKLDNCNKLFSSRGNLKSHQNSFHKETIRYLTMKFVNLKDLQDDMISAADKQLLEYFAPLYKNLNKGIKGRGKNRNVSTVPRVKVNTSITLPSTSSSSSSSTTPAAKNNSSTLPSTSVGRSCHGLPILTSDNTGMSMDKMNGVEKYSDGFYEADNSSAASSSSFSEPSSSCYDGSPSTSFSSTSSFSNASGYSTTSSFSSAPGSFSTPPTCYSNGNSRSNGLSFDGKMY